MQNMAPICVCLCNPQHAPHFCKVVYTKKNGGGGGGDGGGEEHCYRIKFFFFGGSGSWGE